MTKDCLILGIETSCDETSAAVVLNGSTVLSNIISSQIKIHQPYGGVVPEIASRKHLEKLTVVVEQALEQAGKGWRDLDGIAVTYGPGLVGALLVGVCAAKAMSYGLGIPLLAVNHIEGHIYANFLDHPQLSPPFLCLVVSGGHTHLIYLPEHNRYQVLGKTLDDAAGEAFDKVARALGLGYPGGPLIERLASGGDRQAVILPRAKLEDSYDFSFSGLKSAVLNYLNRAQMRGEEVNKADLAAGFQQAVVDVLVEKTVRAAVTAAKTGKIVLAGGVAANKALREQMTEAACSAGFEVFVPSLEFCTDNAAMIACAGYHRFLRGEFAPLTLNAVANVTLGDSFGEIKGCG